jgi:DNA-binding NarL/FixJ family response regulator
MPNRSNIRLAIADDHEIFRQGFKALIGRQSRLEIVGEAGNGKDLLELIVRLQPNLVFVDIKMPIMDGIDATREIKNSFPSIKVIALSMFNDENLVADMLYAGASGYLLKDASQEELLSAINAVMNGGSYFCGDTSERINALVETTYFYPDKGNLRLRFSEREISVIRLICEEYTTKEIASKLGLSHRTIDSYRDTIQQKTNSKNMVGIALYAVKKGIYKLEL